jgi:hypothetical protein
MARGTIMKTLLISAIAIAVVILPPLVSHTAFARAARNNTTYGVGGCVASACPLYRQYRTD